MKKLHGFFIAFSLILVVNLYDAISVFGMQTVDLPRLQFVLFSIWVLLRNSIGYALLIASPALFIGRFSRFLLIPIFAYILGVEVLSAYTAKVFHAQLSEIWLPLVLNTSFQEMVGFVKMVGSPICIIALASYFVIVFVSGMFLWKARYSKISYRSGLMGVIACVPFVITNCIFMNMKFGLTQMRYTDFFVSAARSYFQNRGFLAACKQPDLPEKLSVSCSKNQLPNGVIVIGESSTRANWHCYGYARHTTPRIDDLCEKGECILYTDVVGIHPDTVGALSWFLTDVMYDGDKSIGYWTMAEVFKRAGYRCVLITNQKAVNDNLSLLSNLFNGCDERISISTIFKGKEHFDEVLIPFIGRELVKKDGRPVMLFVHLSGIHFPVHNANPKEDAHFVKGEESFYVKDFSDKMRDRVNRYDDGVLYEDKVLGLIVDVLKTRDEATFMFFISDHGESPFSEGWRSYVDENVYELPAFFWFSNSYRLRFPDMVEKVTAASKKALQPDEMTTGLFDLCFIDDSLNGHRRMSFTDKSFAGRKPRPICKGRMKYPKDLRIR